MYFFRPFRHQELYGLGCTKVNTNYLNSLQLQSLQNNLLLRRFASLSFPRLSRSTSHKYHKQNSRVVYNHQITRRLRSFLLSIINCISDVPSIYYTTRVLQIFPHQIRIREYVHLIHFYYIDSLDVISWPRHILLLDLSTAFLKIKGSYSIFIDGFKILEQLNISNRDIILNQATENTCDVKFVQPNKVMRH